MRNIILLSFAALLLTLFEAQPSHAEDGWMLRQKAKGFGSLTIFACSKGLRIQKADPEYTIVCKAPDWNIVVFSRQTKSYFATPLAKFDSMSSMNLSDFSELVMNRVGKHSLVGVDGIRMTGTVPSKWPSEYKQMEPILLTYTNLLGIQKSAADAMCKMYGVPAKGFPLECSYTYPHAARKKVYRFKTLSLDKITMQNTDLSMPPGLKKVPNLDKVIVRDLLID